jgi:hypothetical protein
MAMATTISKLADQRTILQREETLPKRTVSRAGFSSGASDVRAHSSKTPSSGLAPLLSRSGFSSPSGLMRVVGMGGIPVSRAAALADKRLASSKWRSPTVETLPAGVLGVAWMVKTQSSRRRGDPVGACAYC